MTAYSLGIFWLSRKRDRPPHTRTYTNKQNTLNLRPFQSNGFYWTMLQILYMQRMWRSPNNTHVRLVPRTSVLSVSKLTIQFLLHH